MSDEFQVFLDYTEWQMAVEAATMGLIAFLAGGNDGDDEEMIQCNEFVLDTLSDADHVAEIDAHVGENIRDQMTVEEAIALHDDAERRRWGYRLS